MDDRQPKALDETSRDADLNLSVNPRRAAQLGAALVEGLRDREVDVVVIWDDPDSAVLAHVVACGLDCQIARAVEIEGLVEMLDAVPDQANAALLAPTFRTSAKLHALESLVRRAAGTVVAVAAGLDSPALSAAAAAGQDVVLPEGAADTSGTAS